jgi:hypothetical protein
MPVTQVSDLILINQISDANNQVNLEQPSVLSDFKRVNQDFAQFLHKNLTRRKTKGDQALEKEKIGGNAA